MAARPELHVVTGAFGYCGRYITELLLREGRRVRTLTGHPDRPNPFGDRVEVRSFCFDDPAALRESLRGATALYNTYWIRFERGETTFERAIANSRALIGAAADAGIRRFVHISITNPSEDSPYPYFRGKAIVERYLTESGLSYAILRPTVLFGREDILINNIAWLLRRLPVFGVFGDGRYRVQPVYVGDVAALAVRQSRETENAVLDAVGPETYSFDDLASLIREKIESRACVVHVPPRLALMAGTMLGWMLNDVVITGDEIGGLMANLLLSDQPPTCSARFSEWLGENAAELGREYASELGRHYR